MFRKNPPKRDLVLGLRVWVSSFFDEINLQAAWGIHDERLGPSQGPSQGRECVEYLGSEGTYVNAAHLPT